jgi:hypothetical protein
MLYLKIFWLESIFVGGFYAQAGGLHAKFRFNIPH